MTWALANVTHGYGAADVLAGFSLALAPGEVVALVGANGTGKTTAARLLLGLETPRAGTVTQPRGARTAAVFQEDRLCGHLCASANVELVLERNKWALVHAELTAAGLASDAHERPVTELSGGQRRRVAIARAMATGASCVVLDEPFQGIDADSRDALIAYVRERTAGAAVLLITHDASDVEAFGARLVSLG